MKILQITACEDYDNSPIVFGLGEDGLVYFWHDKRGEWRINGPKIKINMRKSFKTKKSSIAFRIILVIITIVMIFWAMSISITRAEILECEKWAEELKEVEGYYLIASQIEQCQELEIIK